MMHPFEGPGRGLSVMPPEDPVLDPECEPVEDEVGETPVAETEVVPEVPEEVVVPNVPE